MLDYVCGKIVTVSSGAIVVEIGGVALRLLVPEALSQTSQPGRQAKLFTHLTLKNEELKLYGFASNEERRMFERLLSVSGIGPALALNILSGMSLASLYQAIVREDLALFKHIKGVGQKTAQRIVLELKGSLQKEKLPAVTPPFPASGSLQSDAIAALLALGYAPDAAATAVNEAWRKLAANSSDCSLDHLVREALAQVSSCDYHPQR